MNRNFNFNPSQVEKHLSPFGQQVLKTLITQWNTEQDRARCYLNPPRSISSRRRVINFGESHSAIARASAALDSLNIEDGICDDAPEYPCLPNSPNFEPPLLLLPQPPNFEHASTVPTSAELVANRPEILDTNHQNHAVHNVSRDDLITSFGISNIEKPKPPKPKSILSEIYGSSDEEDFEINENINEINNNKGSNLSQTDNINWDDMFDSELLLGDEDVIKPKIIDDKVVAPQNIFCKPMFDVQFPKEIEKENKNQNTFKKPQVASKKVKRKNQTVNPEPIQVKKVKTDIPKPLRKLDFKKKSFRKEKYTKTVNNWLNDVDPNNHVEEASDAIGNNLEISKRNDAMPIVIEKDFKKKSTKKVIQSQLANKDGVMKFEKPKTVVTKEITEPNEPEQGNKTETLITNTKTDATLKDKPKEKKSKSKFVAPIKSQIPVRDIVYEIKVLDDSNITQLGSVLRKKMNEKVIAILLYSNGFCQLNSQHTDDSCKPDTVMCLIEDTFYCFKGLGDKNSFQLSTIFKNNTIICYEGKALLMYLMAKYSMEFDTTLRIFDAKIAGFLLEPDAPPENFSELQKICSYETQFTVATECVLQKAAWYSSTLLECFEAAKTLLEQNKLWDIFVDIEMRLLPVIADMESTGILVDMDSLKSMEEVLMSKIKVVEAACYEAAGKNFNIGSTQQVRALLYDELKLDTKTNVKIRETLTLGAKSTSETMLRSLVGVHPLPALIMEYRRLHKAHATFLAGIRPHVKDGIIRPTWLQTAAATGRIGCCSPNLQAIPKAPFTLADHNNSTTENNPPATTSIHLRDMYISREGHTLLVADFRQVECRIFARAANDLTLQHALTAEDLFTELAALWLQKPVSSISGSERERTKRVVYASLYGAGARALQDMLDTDYQHALQVIASFNRTFPSLKTFCAKTVDSCTQDGGRVRTLCGRQRRLPLAAGTSGGGAQTTHAHRQAVNFVIQGTAADLCKLGMVEAVQQLRQLTTPGCARLLLQVHDELVWEVVDDQLDGVAGIVQQALEGCGRRAGLPSLPVALYTGQRWGRLTPYNK